MDGRTKVVMRIIFLLVGIPLPCTPKIVVLGELVHGQRTLGVLVGLTDKQKDRHGWSCRSFFTTTVGHELAYHK